MTDTNNSKLLRMKESINQAKSDIDRLQGKQEQLYETLKEEHGCKTTTEAKTELKKINDRLDAQEKELTEGVVDLENAYNWSN